MARPASLTDGRIRPGPRGAIARSRFALSAGAYALAIVYVSTVLGPTGLNFVPRDPVTAWHVLLATPYVETGSDQRPDWMANLLMLVPLGFLTTGALWSTRSWLRQSLALGGALISC